VDRGLDASKVKLVAKGLGAQEAALYLKANPSAPVDCLVTLAACYAKKAAALKDTICESGAAPARRLGSLKSELASRQHDLKNEGTCTISEYITGR